MNQNTGFVVGLGVAFAIVIFTLFAGTYYQQVAPPSTATPSASQTGNSAIMANWKTYTGKGYTIRYPDSLKYSASTYDGIGGKVTVDSWMDSGNTYSIGVDSYKDGVNSKLEFNIEPQPEVTILVAGQSIKKLVSKDGTLIHVGPLKNKGQNYMITYSSGIKKADSSIFDQILSTFRFTN